MSCLPTVLLASSPSSSKSRAARFFAFLLCEVKISVFVFEGRGRPADVGLEEEVVVRRLESVDVKARLVDEEISLGVFLGLRIP